MDKHVFLMRLMDNLKREEGKQIKKSLVLCVCVPLNNQASVVHIDCFLFHKSLYTNATHMNYKRLLTPAKWLSHPYSYLNHQRSNLILNFGLFFFPLLISVYSNISIMVLRTKTSSISGPSVNLMSKTA